MTAPPSGVDLRLNFDLVADEGSKRRMILYNVRTVDVDAEIARSALEIAHWVLEKSGTKVPIGPLEFVDINSGHVHTCKTRRKRTMTRMKQGAQIIQALWPTL